MTTLYSVFRERWKYGCGSDCCKGARVVLARGKVPCEVLFVGEAPGESENVLGRPFVGPAGKLLDRIIAQSLPPDLPYALTNIVGCIPRDFDLGGKAAEPDPEQVESCKPRLQEFIEIADPKLIVAVGAMARDYLKPGFKSSIKLHRPIPLVDIVHPAAILRANVANKGFMIQRAAVVIKTAVGDYLN